MLNTPEKVQQTVGDPVIREAIMPGFNRQNIEIVAVWMNGPRDLGYKGQNPILLPEDAKGLKVRVQSAPIFVKTWEAVGANKQWWDSKPADVKSEVQAALAAATEWNMAKNTEINNGDMEWIAAQGVSVHYLDDTQRAAWAAAMKPVRDELGTGLVGDDVMARLKDIAGVN